MPGVSIFRYGFQRGFTQGIHPLAAEFETKVMFGEAVGRAAMALKEKGFVPDIICGHPGWGETLYLKDVWPHAKLLSFREFYYHFDGADVNFDPEFQDTGFEAAARVRTKNAYSLLAMESSDWGVSPTEWQKRQFPDWVRSNISVIHDGIDTDAVAPDPHAELRLQEKGAVLKAGDEVITFINRNLEPYRGYHIFMRSLPEVLRRRPDAHVLIIGGEGISYGAKAPDGKTWKQIYLDEVADDIDRSRVHFVGNVGYQAFLRVLQISAVHVYLTYPFVLSWSMLEAMSCGCLVIGSRTAPVEEVIRDGENGLLVDFFDPAALAEKMISVLADPAAHAPLRLRAREHIVANYDLRTVCLPRHIELIEKLASSSLLAG